MNPIEPSYQESQSSRSADFLTSKDSKEIILGRYKKIDSLFPLFDQICGQISVIPFINGLVFIYFCLQFLFSALNPFHQFWDELNNSGSIWKSLILAFYFLDISSGSSAYILSSIIIFFVSIIIMVWQTAVLANFKINHRFSRWMVVPVKYMLQVFVPILLHPVAAHFGYGLVLLFENHSITVIAGWIFSIIAMVLIFLLFIVSHILFLKSSCLDITYFAMIDPEPLITFVVSSPIILAANALFTVFADWTTIISMVAHLIVYSLILYTFTYMLFHSNFSNVIMSSVVTSSLFLDIMMIVLTFLDSSTLMYIVVACILCGTLVISIISYSILYKVHENQITEKLAEIASHGDDEKAELYCNLNLANNQNKCSMYLMVALKRISPALLDWSLIKFISQNHQTEKCLSICLQIVSLFPFETRYASVIVRLLFKIRKLQFGNRFLLYQIYRLKTLRQSSMGIAANEKFTELKAANNQCNTVSMSFWSLPKTQVNQICTISEAIQDTKAQWEEGIKDYPNNTKIVDEYSKFLIDTACDFDEAINMKYHIQMIELGSSFTVDKSFVSLIKNYPQYIKKRIVDLFGRRVTSSDKDDTPSLNDAVSSMGSSASSSVFIDQEARSNISKQTMVQAKLRLALSDSIDGRKSSSGQFMNVVAVIILLITVGTFVVLAVFVAIMFSGRENGMNRAEQNANTRFYIGVAETAYLLTQAFNAGKFKAFKEITKLTSEDKSNEYYLPISSALTTQAILYTATARTQLNNLLGEITDLSSEGKDPFEFAGPIFSNGALLKTCRNIASSGTKLDVANETDSDMASIYAYTSLILDMLSADKYVSIPTILSSVEVCDMWMNYLTIDELQVSTSQSLVSYMVSDCKSTDEFITILMISVPVALVVIVILLVSTTMCCYTREIYKFGDALLSYDEAQKLEIKRSLLKEFQDEEPLQAAHIKPSNALNGLVIGMIILNIIASGILFYMIYVIKENNLEFKQFNQWQYFASIRGALCSDVIAQLFFTIRTYNTPEIGYQSTEKAQQRITTVLEKLDEANRNLLFGNGESKSCSGYDDLLDQYNSKESCTLLENETSYHDLYKCSSITNTLTIFITSVTDALLNISQYGNSLDAEMVIHSFHCANNHLWVKLAKSLQRINSLYGESYQSMNITVIVICCIGIIIGIISFALTLFLAKKMQDIYKVLLIFLKRVPPTMIIGNKVLMEVVLKQVSRKRKEMTSTSGNIIMHNSDPILFTNNTGNVEFVNTAITDFLGYTPEQVLGQPVASLFTEQDSVTVKERMNMMIAGQSPLIYNDSWIILSNEALEMPVNVNILAISSGLKGISTFVYILRDEGELIRKREESENAKAKSEQLLYQILPRDIVNRLNDGEKDICITVPHASVIFIDIVKFSDYTAMLTPPEIMGNLSTIFQAFDEIAAKYPLITKIKLIGDVYMAAAGLFGEPDEKEHAQQIVNFGLEAIQAIDEINVKLDASLQVRVGVNTGGPLLAGVLGTDKPVFDIIGDTINVAARLQSTDIPGRVQISQNTYDLISDNSTYDIERRGEIYLKGKGQQMAYLVNPIAPMLTNLSNSDFHTMSGVLQF